MESYHPIPAALFLYFLTLLVVWGFMSVPMVEAAFIESVGYFFTVRLMFVLPLVVPAIYLKSAYRAKK